MHGFQLCLPGPEVHQQQLLGSDTRASSKSLAILGNGTAKMLLARADQLKVEKGRGFATECPLQMTSRRSHVADIVKSHYLLTSY